MLYCKLEVPHRRMSELGDEMQAVVALVVADGMPKWWW